jgi:hypothetical protein
MGDFLGKFVVHKRSRGCYAPAPRYPLFSRALLESGALAFLVAGHVATAGGRRIVLLALKVL